MDGTAGAGPAAAGGGAGRGDDPAVPPQVIPRPPGARPGDPAPWADLDPGRRRGLSLERVRQVLAGAGQAGPPPARVGDDPWVEVLDTTTPVDRAVSSAVLVALFEEAGEARVVLTRRSSALRSHRGEVSFPGGRTEPGEGPVAAALRESQEEVGLDPGLVEVVGWLHPLLTFSSGSLVVPVVGVLAERPVLVPNPGEVERAFDAALAEFVADGVFTEERWSIPGRPGSGEDGSFPLWFFAVAGETVWGATARMLMELLALVVGVELPGR